MQPVGQLTCYHTLGCGMLKKTQNCARSRSGFDPPCWCGLVTLPVGARKPGFNVSLLCVSRQIHTEVAEILFGGREFVFVLALINREFVHPHHRGSLPPKFSWVLIDNLQRVSARYLPLLKRLRLYVHLPLSCGSNRELFIHFKSQIRKFAERFGGQNHSLQSFRVFLNDLSVRHIAREVRPYWHVCPTNITFGDPTIMRYQNVLEPLGMIHNIPDPQYISPQLEFGAKMEQAMKSKFLLCAPKKQAYSTRITKVKGRKTAQRFESDCHYDAKYEFFDRAVRANATLE